MAMRVFNVGDVLGAADTNEFLVNTRFAQKPSDTARASNTTMTADPHLVLPLDVNKTYQLDMLLLFHALAGADLQWQLSGPAGAKFYGSAHGPDLAIGGPTGPWKVVTWSDSAAFNAQRTWGGFGVGSDLTCRVGGTVINSTTPGNLSLNWAQNTTSGTGTVMLAGSWMVLRRVS